MLMKDYIYIICPFVTLVICQVIKFTLESIGEKKLKWGRLFNGAGGMPSSHTSFSSSITMLIGWTQGFTSPMFALGMVFTGIVSYDAMGLRMESGKQASVINMIVDEIFEKDPLLGMKHLKEELGHQPLEVLIGLILGTLMSFIFYLQFYVRT